jgi:hypothetical protein
MRFTLLAAVFLVVVTNGAASAQAAEPRQTTQQPPTSGTPQQNSTVTTQGVTPAPATPLGATVPPAAPPLVTPVIPGTASVAPEPLGRVFGSQAGLILNAIKPDKVMDFETVIAKLRAALVNSKDPVRQQQGSSWKIYKMVESGPNSALYVFIMDPAVKGADYGVAKILAEAYPNEITDLYRMYTRAFAIAGQQVVSLQPVTDNPLTRGNTPDATTTPTSTTPTTPAPADATPPTTAQPPTTATPPLK